MEYFGYNKQKKADPSKTKEDYYAQEANQIVRRVDPRPRFHPIIANRPFESVQADVLDMSYYVGQNHKRRYLLTFIDVYSRYVWFYVMNKKSELTDGIKAIFKEMGKTPENITTDNEFVNNNEIQKMFKDKSINHFVEDIDDHRKQFEHPTHNNKNGKINGKNLYSSWGGHHLCIQQIDARSFERTCVQKTQFISRVDSEQPNRRGYRCYNVDGTKKNFGSNRWHRSYSCGT
jgi:hypothetical protein